MKYKPYLRAFKNGFSTELAYPVNFFMGRLRNVLLLILVYYVWQAVFAQSTRFSGVSLAWFLSYIFIAHIVKSFVVGAQFREVAYEITNGTFSKFLLQPIHHGVFHFFQGLAPRMIHAVTACVEVIIFCVLFSFTPQIGSFSQVLFGIFFLSVAYGIYFLLAYTAQLLAFWSQEAMGPLFFFDWFMEFSSGSMFPLIIMSPFLYHLVLHLPFAYTVYIPTTLFMTGTQIHLSIIGICILLCILLYAFSRFIFFKGLRQYSGDGI